MATQNNCISTARVLGSIIPNRVSCHSSFSRLFKCIYFCLRLICNLSASWFFTHLCFLWGRQGKIIQEAGLKLSWAKSIGYMVKKWFIRPFSLIKKIDHWVHNQTELGLKSGFGIFKPCDFGQAVYLLQALVSYCIGLLFLHHNKHYYVKYLDYLGT